MINYVYVWLFVFSDVLIEIFVLHRYFSQYLSLYEVFNVHSISRIGAHALEVTS